MEAVVLSAGKSVLNGVLGYAKSAFAEEVALQLGVQRDQAFIVDELEMMQSFMMEAHKEQDDSEIVKTWVKQVRDMAYDAEDCLQDFVVRMEKRPWWQYHRTLLDRRLVAKQMKKLRVKVEDVSQRNVRYRLVKGFSFAAATAAEQSRLTVASKLSIDYARRIPRSYNQKVDLIQLINQEDKDLKVIAVWGTSSDIIGQTTIVRTAYENPDVLSKFPCRAWVRVTHPFSPHGFIQSLVNQFQVAYEIEDLLETTNTVQDLAKKFKEYVNENRFLIVLNGLSTIDEWDQIKRCFPNKKDGSRIIVSTTQVEVAKLCVGQESQIFELRRFSHDQTLYAFYGKGSPNGNGLVKVISSSDVATTSTNGPTEAPNEIKDDHSDDELKVVKKSLTRIKTCVFTMEESQLIGREREKSELLQLIVNTDSQVISLWGMGGIGKTTLVKGIYRSPKLSNMFEKRAFVTIIRPFNVADVLRSLIVQLCEESSKKEELLNNTPDRNNYELIHELNRLLETKSSLIVLDGLSSIKEWDIIADSLLWTAKATKIIVTTRILNIAKHCAKDNTYNLGTLNKEESLYLLTLKVFGYFIDIYDEEYRDLVEEAKLILKKCNGLPSAIIVIGGFLAGQPKTPEEWKKLNENLSADGAEMNPELSTIRIIITKGYDGLPKPLKFCFLYLSIFPEDYNISRRRLVRRWAAEGYSSELRGMSATEMADEYFMELERRCLILTSQKSVHSRESVEYCHLHDLVREIAISKSTEENLVFRLEEGCSLNTHGGLYRHLAISSDWKGDQSEFESIEGLSRIRSLTVFGNCRPFYISDKMRFLRVLDFEGTSALGYHDLDHIGKLLHLKYLSLRGCRGIHLLPGSFGNLRQLETLDIRNTAITALPKTAIKLRKLQYIHAGRKLTKSEYEYGASTEEDRSSTTGCAQLLSAGHELCAICCKPSVVGIDDLSRCDACTLVCCVLPPAIMRGIYEKGGVIVPMGTRKLKHLHTLRDVYVGRGNAVLHDIRMLKGMRKLGVTGINKKNGHAFCSAISNLSRLESLSVRLAGMSGLHCLDGIYSPPYNLQSLKLYGNLKRLPEWITGLQNLVKLKLVGTRILENNATLQLLGKLPNLAILVLSWAWSSSFEFGQFDFRYMEFPSLRVFNFEVNSNIESVRFEEGGMRRLERLQVTGEVNNRIDFSGLESLPNINNVQLGIDFPGEAAGRKLKEKIQEQLDRNPNGPILTIA